MTFPAVLNHHAGTSERRSSLENITSVKSRIESYLGATEEEQQQQQLVAPLVPGMGMGQQLKSILVKKS